jgi:hypothetical protein
MITDRLPAKRVEVIKKALTERACKTLCDSQPHTADAARIDDRVVAMELRPQRDGAFNASKNKPPVMRNEAVARKLSAPGCRQDQSTQAHLEPKRREGTHGDYHWN